jgi:hypothetical protein
LEKIDKIKLGEVEGGPSDATENEKMYMAGLGRVCLIAHEALAEFRKREK